MTFDPNQLCLLKYAYMLYFLDKQLLISADFTYPT